MTNFVLIGDDGKAIQYVVERLREHPSCLVYGELFNRSDGDLMEHHDKQGVLIKYDEDPFEFLNFVFKGSPDVLATGFALTSKQARCAAWSRLWGYLRKNTKIVRVAWDNVLNGMIHSDFVYIDQSELNKKKEYAKGVKKDLDQYLQGVNTVSATPENLHNQWETLLEFLKLPYTYSPSSFQSKSYKDVIENYAELQ